MDLKNKITAQRGFSYLFDLEKHTKTIALSQVKKFDMIEYGNDRIPTSVFIVFDISIDDSLPAILLQLWKFEGGYDHSFVNVMETDFGLNKRVRYFIPKIIKGEIKEIISYRKKDTKLSEKEEFFFDLWPDAVESNRSSEFSIPFKGTCEFGTQLEEIIFTTWTPLQKIPTDRIKKGTIVELWSIDHLFVLMKVLKL